jgi:hypothetical protein
LNLAVYRVGPGAVDPPGFGEGISLALPCVLGGFRRVDEPVDVAAVLPGWLVPDCSQDARNAKPIRTAMREIGCLFIPYSLIASRRVCGCLKANEAFGMLTMSPEYRTRYVHKPGPKVSNGLFTSLDSCYSWAFSELPT